ncbi:MAG: hypothetical protein COT25_04010 [Candidatus Kerfeldbacteria bacterium CG08_land_8_20_14_0_20_42_7]|uniref:Response regulatory domain-containing protein n=1 Tax=Candidatus Kerfeldbacteria bacterium CG08_land_8_20_14_0_20_42_7 TaxID=2014245 RepID=A0A2H0YRZ3_9BACT|nr:MAG: hypothetical protein COT25_04010 [Candidatus Kerfeldbacteria bacterium CG08_land_8_20_14_0_20_42_7]
MHGSMKSVPLEKKQPQVYIIQSGTSLTHLLTDELSVRGYSVTALHSEPDALAELSKKDVSASVLIVDVTDNEIDAFHLLQKIKEQERTFVSIVVSATDEAVDLDRALAHGAEDYIIKDQFSVEELVSKIRRAQLRLNVAQTPMITPSEQELGAFDTTAIHVLIIEDDQFLRDLASRKLKQEGFQVDIAIDGTEGLKKIEHDRPTVVLLDIILPGLDGFDILKKVRAHKNAGVSGTVVILLSNLGQEADVAKGERLGADDYLIKANFTIDEIIEKIKTAVIAKRGRSVT